MKGRIFLDYGCSFPSKRGIYSISGLADSRIHAPDDAAGEIDGTSPTPDPCNVKHGRQRDPHRANGLVAEPT